MKKKEILSEQSKIIRKYLARCKSVFEILHFRIAVPPCFLIVCSRIKNPTAKAGVAHLFFCAIFTLLGTPM